MVIMTSIPSTMIVEGAMKSSVKLHFEATLEVNSFIQGLSEGRWMELEGAGEANLAGSLLVAVGVPWSESGGLTSGLTFEFRLS